MSWYNKAMALEPGMWSTDEAPHRTREDAPVVWTPWGRMHQNVNIDDIATKYTGVHFTDSVEYAAIYANNKGSKDDPPVIIEVDATGFDKLPDVDAAADTSLEDYIHEAWLGTWADIILHSDAPVEQKADELMSSIQSDAEFSEGHGDVIDNVVDYIQENFKGLAPQVISNALEGKPAEEIVAALQTWAKDGPPPALLIEIARQFRVMHPVGQERVIAIYQIEPFSEDFSDGYRDWDDDEEEETEEGYDAEGRRLLDYETLDYGWPDLYPLYQNPNTSETSESVYHGTSYKRAKQAFPELLP